MKNVQGGLSPCAKSMIGLSIGFVGAFFVTTPVGAAVFAAGFIWGAATTGC